MSEWPTEIADTSDLSDTDWAEINKLKAAFASGGETALSKACAELATQPVRYLRVMGTFFPEKVRDAIRDDLAECGITEEDIREMIRKAESPSRGQH